jgi:hypothetical protein
LNNVNGVGLERIWDGGDDVSGGTVNHRKTERTVGRRLVFDDGSSIAGGREDRPDPGASEDRHRY